MFSTALANTFRVHEAPPKERSVQSNWRKIAHCGDYKNAINEALEIGSHRNNEVSINGPLIGKSLRIEATNHESTLALRANSTDLELPSASLNTSYLFPTC